jgi:predicted Zn-dependent protease
MTHLTYVDQLAALRSVVFTAVQDWNAAHPHPLGSRREHAAVNVTQVFTDTGGEPSFTITVTCALAGSANLNFHGQDLPAVVEHARLTLEHRIAAEVERRAAKALEIGLDQKFGVAV